MARRSSNRLTAKRQLRNLTRRNRSASKKASQYRQRGGVLTAEKIEYYKDLLKSYINELITYVSPFDLNLYKSNFIKMLTVVSSQNKIVYDTFLDNLLSIIVSRVKENWKDPGTGISTYYQDNEAYYYDISIKDYISRLTLLSSLSHSEYKDNIENAFKSLGETYGYEKDIPKFNRLTVVKKNAIIKKLTDCVKLILDNKDNFFSTYSSKKEYLDNVFSWLYNHLDDISLLNSIVDHLIINTNANIDIIDRYLEVLEKRIKFELKKKLSAGESAGESEGESEPIMLTSLPGEFIYNFKYLAENISEIKEKDSAYIAAADAAAADTKRLPVRKRLPPTPTAKAPRLPWNSEGLGDWNNHGLEYKNS